MRTLLIMRHAKSAWDDPSLDDHQRTLNRKGVKDAPRMGRFIASKGLLPDRVLCSDSVRTRATLALLLAEWPDPPPLITFEPGLYLAEPPVLKEAIRHLDASVKRCLLLAHNPGVHGLALGLSGGGDKRALADVATQFPTSGLAVIDFDGDDWSRTFPGSGRLRMFMYPKAL